MSLLRNFWIKKPTKPVALPSELVLRVYRQVKVHKLFKIPHKMATVQSPKKVPNYSPKHYPPKARQDAQESDLAFRFDDLSQSEKTF